MRQKVFRSPLPVMVRISAAILITSTIACGSAQLPEGIVPPDVAIGQMFTGDAMFQMRGRVSVPYVMEITNTSDVPITLERVQLRSIGAGAYDVQETVNVERQEIAPGATRQINFSAWGFSHGGSMNASVPTTLRATAHFDSPLGKFRRVITGSVGGMHGTVN